MLFICGQFLFGFRGCLLAMSKQPLQNHLENSNPSMLAWAAGSRFRVEEPSRVGIFPEIPSAKTLVKDNRGARARERKGEKKATGRSQSCVDGGEEVRLRQRGPARGALPPAARVLEQTGAPCSPRGGHWGARTAAAPDRGSEPALSGASSSSGAVTFSAVLAGAR